MSRVLHIAFPIPTPGHGAPAPPGRDWPAPRSATHTRPHPFPVPPVPRSHRAAGSVPRGVPARQALREQQSPRLAAAPHRGTGSAPGAAVRYFPRHKHPQAARPGPRSRLWPGAASGEQPRRCPRAGDSWSEGRLRAGRICPGWGFASGDLPALRSCKFHCTPTAKPRRVVLSSTKPFFVYSGVA